MSLSTHIQTVRKLKPFLEAFTAMLAMADTLETAEQRILAIQADETKAKQAADSARADASQARTFAADTVAKAKAEADEIAGKAQSVLADAKDDADNIRASAQGDAQATVKRADAKVASLEAEAATLAEAIKAKAAECAALDKRIADNRAILRKQAEI